MFAKHRDGAGWNIGWYPDKKRHTQLSLLYVKGYCACFDVALPVVGDARVGVRWNLLGYGYDLPGDKKRGIALRRRTWKEHVRG